jgi:hypothetical protein
VYNSCIRLPRVTLPVLGLTCLLSLVSLPVPAQTPDDSDHVAAIAARPVQVPPLIQFSNVANDEGGAPLAGRVDITFSLYANQRGGDPLWTETQHGDLDSAGRYSVQLGATQPQGVPTALFSSGEARWPGCANWGASPAATRAVGECSLRLESSGCADLGGTARRCFPAGAGVREWIL